MEAIAQTKTSPRTWEQTVASLTRLSYLTKGILYGCVALFAIQFALGQRGPDPGRKAVLQEFIKTDVGAVVLVLMTISLAGHTVWRMAEIYFDPYKKGKGVLGWIYRLNYFLSGLTYTSLGITAVKLLMGQADDQNQKQLWVSKILMVKGGDWLIILVGVFLMLWAGLQMYKGISGTVYKSLNKEAFPTWLHGFLWMCNLVGFLTVGGILASTSWYLVKGAWKENPHWVMNMDDLIKSLQAFPGGQWIQITTAVGLTCMAIFMLAMARCFPIKTTSSQAC